MTTCDTVVICAELTELAPLVNRSWLRECLSHRHQDSYTPEDPRKALPTPVTEVSGLGFYPLDFPEVPSGILAVQSGERLMLPALPLSRLRFLELNKCCIREPLAV